MNNQQLIARNILILIAGLIAVGYTWEARAATVSEHTTFHVALENAVNAVLPCNEINIAQNPKFQFTDANTIEGVKWRVECLTPATGAKVQSVTIRFTQPTAREDGTPLACDEIAEYRIETDCTTASGWTTDTNGLESSQPAIAE